MATGMYAAVGPLRENMPPESLKYITYRDSVRGQQAIPRPESTGTENFVKFVRVVSKIRERTGKQIRSLQYFALHSGAK